MYYYTTELGGVWDCWNTATDFINDMKITHPNVTFTHIGGDEFCMQSEKITDLYAAILNSNGDDVESALITINDSVVYRSY